MISGIAHTAVRVVDVDAAVAWYRDVLGMAVLSPSYRMDGEAITRDMGELVPAPVVVKAAIVGVDGMTDVAGLRTTWFCDPWANVFILVEKVRRPDRPYFRRFCY